MEELQELVEEMVQEGLQRVILSNPVKAEKGSKIKITPVLIKGSVRFQETLYRGTQVFHYNGTKEELTARLMAHIRDQFRQAEFTSDVHTATVLVSKKGKITIKKKKREGTEESGEPKETKGNGQAVPAHNRVKKYILEEGQPIDFLVGLGVQTSDGQIVKAKYDKFRQINRYLEFIGDIVKKLPTDRPVRIIDFGCGKAYLTFAMYYYLHVMKGYALSVTGLDLKEDVIDFCNALAEKFHYENLHFEKGDIGTYEGAESVDMVVTLHACDTATDYALYKAVKWGAQVIMAVPCCQHEVNRQLSCPELSPILKYGIVKERMAALMTDAARANLLEEMGYETQILEFIDMEHTPKNLLIRAVKRTKIGPRTGISPRTKIRPRSEIRSGSGSHSMGGIRRTTEFLHVETTLQRLLEEERAD